MHTNHLVSSEISNLWRAYQSETMANCFIRYFEQCIEDLDGKALLQRHLEAQESHIAALKGFFEKIEMPIPHGFTAEDVNPKAPKLYNDSFIIQFLAFMDQVATQNANIALTTTPTAEVRSFFTKQLFTYTDLANQTFEVLLEKGIFVRAPYVPYPKEVKFIQGQSFLSELFGNKQPINMIELTQLFINSIRNQLGSLLLTGFIQVTSQHEIREYFLKGKQISQEISGIFNNVLRDSEIPPVTLINVGVTDSTVSPFSDRLILNLVAALNVYGLGIIGLSLSQITRPDLVTQLTRLAAETGKYRTEGLQLLVKHGYMEAPPQVPDREDLAKQE